MTCVTQMIIGLQGRSAKKPRRGRGFPAMGHPDPPAHSTEAEGPDPDGPKTESKRSKRLRKWRDQALEVLDKIDRAGSPTSRLTAAEEFLEQEH